MDRIKALKKLAYDENNETAGVGTWNQNAVGKAERVGNEGFVSAPVGEKTVPIDNKSYFAQLLANAKKDPAGSAEALNVLDGVAPRVYQGEADGDDDIKQTDLEYLRGTQADHAAQRYFGGSDAIRKYLMDAGKKNQKAYTGGNGGTVPYRPVDLPSLMKYLNGRKISPEQLKILRSIQNSMVRAKARPSAPMA